jgi:hypothetical protein
MWCPSTIILAMSIPGLRSLELSMVRRVVPCQRSTHPDLVSIGHECATCRGVRVINVPQSEGFVGHKCFVVRGVRRL